MIYNVWGLGLRVWDAPFGFQGSGLLPQQWSFKWMEHDVNYTRDPYYWQQPRDFGLGLGLNVASFTVCGHLGKMKQT